MKPFKFFHQLGIPLFQTEITRSIYRTPDSNLIWSHLYSQTIKEWISELYFTNTYNNPNLYFKYIHQIDRTCEIMEQPEITNLAGSTSNLFNIKIKIWATNWNWMIVTLSYPIDHIIYR